MLKKREYTTKQIVVPAKYLLACISKDPNTKYPIEISILGRYTCSHQLDNARELKDASHSKMYFENGVIRVLRRNGHICLDLKKGGSMVISKEMLPMRKHLETLTESQVRELYEAMFV